MFITDAAVRDNFTQDLDKILNYSGQIRIEAFNNLMNTVAGSGQSKTQIYRALRFLTNESGYKTNPFLLLAFAQTTIYQSSTPSMGSAQFGQGQIANVIKLTNENLYNTQTRSALTKITKAEAAVINGFASNLYALSNADADANYRRWIERFLRMSPQERDSYDEDDLILLTAPNTSSMRASNNLEKQLKKTKDDFEEQNELWRKTDNIGAPHPVKQDHRSGELFQKSTDTYEREGWKLKKDRGKKKGYEPKTEPVLKPNEYNPYRVMNRTVDANMAIFSLYLEAAKFRQIAARLAIITEYLNKKEKLEKAIRNERVRLKPPPPEITLKHIEELQRYGRITANPFEKRRIAVTLRQLYMLLEEGYAYYR